MISNKRRQHKNTFFGIIIYSSYSLISTLLFFLIGLLGAINLQPLYLLNSRWLDIPSKFSISYELLKHDYSNMLRYLLPFSSSKPEFSALPLTSSSTLIFSDLQFELFILTLIFLIVLIIFILFTVLLRKAHYFSFAVAAFIMPVITIAGSVLLFLFPAEIFHFVHVFFFGRSFARADELCLLTLFPNLYRLQCCIITILPSVIAALILYKSYKKHTKQNVNESLLPKKQNYYYI